MSLPPSVKSTRALLEAPGPLHGPLIAKAKRLLGLEPAVRRCAGGEVKVAALDDACLTLVTASSAQATRLRYSQQSIVSALAAAAIAVKRVKVLVRPEAFAPSQEPPSPRRLSPASARIIMETAKEIKDPALRGALNRLATAHGGR